MVMTTGVGAPFSRFCVWALNALQNSMMLRPRWPSAGPIGGDGFAAPAGTCSFKYPVIFFAIAYSCWCRRHRLFRSVVRRRRLAAALSFHAPLRSPDERQRNPGFADPHVASLMRGLRTSQLLHLSELELDRRRPAEDRHRDLHARAAVVDLLDDAVERGEWAVGHAHLLAHLERYRRLRPLDPFLHLMQDARGFRVRDRHRLVVRTEEAGHLRGILDEVIGLVGQIHLHQHVAGKELAFGVDLAAAPDLDRKSTR